MYGTFDSHASTGHTRYPTDLGSGAEGSGSVTVISLGGSVTTARSSPGAADVSVASSLAAAAVVSDAAAVVSDDGATVSVALAAIASSSSSSPHAEATSASAANTPTTHRYLLDMRFPLDRGMPRAVS